MDILYNLDTTSASIAGVVKGSLGKKPESCTRVVIYWLTLLGGLCGSENNTWNILMLLRKLNVAMLIRAMLRLRM